MEKNRTVNAKGKRKRACARATLSKGTGIVRVNKNLLENVQPGILRLKMQEPLVLAGPAASGVDIDVTAQGGGVMGQADAVRQAIAKALVEWTGSDDLKKKFAAYDKNLLVFDPRRTEPHKQNASSRGPRRKKQTSKR